MPMLFYVPDQDVVGEQSINNKQGRGRALDAEAFDNYLASLEEAYGRARMAYEYQVGLGVARETARGVLPVTTYTQWYWKIDLHNLLHFLTLRCAPDAQLEIRVFANIIAGMIKRIAPLSFEAWIDYNFAGERMSRMELEVLRRLLTLGENDSIMWRSDALGIARLDSGYMERMGLSRSEIVEFAEKLRGKDIPSFELDLSVAKDGEYFQKKWEEAVPKVDRAGI